jgi:hypothetical protein
MITSSFPQLARRANSILNCLQRPPNQTPTQAREVPLAAAAGQMPPPPQVPVQDEAPEVVEVPQVPRRNQIQELMNGYGNVKEGSDFKNYL